jgi:hypothetical protein
VYRAAGRRVGPEVEEYWDDHWYDTVAYRLAELSQSEFGLGIARLIIEGGEEPAGRDLRDTTRESRDRR